MFVIDGNFTAMHLRQKHPENDVWLADGTGYMSQQAPYQEHLKVARDRKEVCVHAVNNEGLLLRKSSIQIAMNIKLEL